MDQENSIENNYTHILCSKTSFFNAIPLFQRLKLAVNMPI